MLSAHWRAAWTRWVAVGLLNTPPNQPSPQEEFPGLVGGTEWSVTIEGWLVPCRASVFCPLCRGLAADAFREDRTAVQPCSMCWVASAGPVGACADAVRSGGIGGGSPSGSVDWDISSSGIYSSPGGSWISCEWEVIGGCVGWLELVSVLLVDKFVFGS